MHFGLTEEQQELQELARDYLSKIRGARAVLEGAEAEDVELWQRIATEMGWPAFAISEDAGGYGFGWVEVAVVLEELGRTLTPCPLLGTLFAVAALTGTGSDALQAIAGGESAALALNTKIDASKDGDGWVLNGEAEQVVDASMAGLIIVEADSGYFLLKAEQVGRDRLPTLDITRSMAKVTLSDARVDANALLSGIDGELLRARCETLIAAEAVGAAEACLDMAVEYAKQREQFGKAIGTFQAIQHKCADMMLAIESARSAAWYAAWAAQTKSDDLREAAHTAKVMASEALFACASENIQIHGGIGFTWELDAHLFFKRAQSTLELLGHPRDHREAVATSLLGAL